MQAVCPWFTNFFVVPWVAQHLLSVKPKLPHFCLWHECLPDIQEAAGQVKCGTKKQNKTDVRFVSRGLAVAPMNVDRSTIITASPQFMKFNRGPLSRIFAWGTPLGSQKQLGGRKIRSCAANGRTKSSWTENLLNHKLPYQSKIYWRNLIA